MNEESSHATLIIKRIEMEERGEMTIEDEKNVEEGRLVVVEIISKKLKFHDAREMKKVALDENREKIDFNEPYITSIINTFFVAIGNLNPNGSEFYLFDFKL